MTLLTCCAAKWMSVLQGCLYNIGVCINLWFCTPQSSLRPYFSIPGGMFHTVKRLLSDWSLVYVGPAGAQPLPLMSTLSGLPLAQPQASPKPSRTISLATPPRPWIDITLLLSDDGEDLIFQPPVADFVRHFDHVLRDLPHSIAVVQRLVTHPDLQVRQLSQHTNLPMLLT